MTVPVHSPRTAPTDRPTRPGRWGRFTRRALVGVLAVILPAGGCKSKEGSTGGSTRASDPLVVGPGRIPKQNIPIPDSGTANGKTRDDPLLGSPTGRPGDRTGAAGYADDPARFKGGPYIPGESGTPAALAARTRDDGDGLKIADGPGGGHLTPAGGLIPSRTDPATGADPVFGQLAAYGVKRGDISTSRNNGQVTIRVKVPITADGAVRSYAGVGPTDTDAVKQVVDQIKADAK